MQIRCQNTNVTPGVANFLIALDKERLQIASAFGKRVRSIQDTMAAAEALFPMEGMRLGQSDLTSLVKV